MTDAASIEQCVSRDALSFSPDSVQSLGAAFDKLLPALGHDVQLLALGEPLHLGEEFMLVRNRLFQHLVEKYNYTAIAIESSFPRAHVVNEYIAGRGPSSYAEIQEAGFSHAFGKLDANRELIEWMRSYNADIGHTAKLTFYGFDSPTEMMHTDSPRQLLHFALDYLASVEPASAFARRSRMDVLLGEEGRWENPAAAFDPSQSIGDSPEANGLRLETEDLITELQTGRPELLSKTDSSRYQEATQHAQLARQLLTYHAAIARPSDTRIAECLGIRDAMMADNLLYMFTRETPRGKIFAHAHNSHMQRGKAEWQLGPHLNLWWPAGAQLHHLLGPRYAVIGAGLAASQENGIAPPEPNTLEHYLAASPGPARFIPTRSLPASASTLPTRSRSTKNFTYFPLTPQSLTDFDAILLLDSAAYARGAAPLPIA